MDFQFKDAYTISDLLEIMRILRAPDGCPWDRVQTHESIRGNFIEETYEVIEAIDKADYTLMREELGDVLMQVIFHSIMEEEAGRFTFDDVCDEVCKKLIVRHPHVFGNVDAETPEEVLRSVSLDFKRRGITHADAAKKMGFGSGPKIGRVLKRLRAAWIDGEIRTEQEETALLEQLRREE